MVQHPTRGTERDISSQALRRESATGNLPATVHQGLKRRIPAAIRGCTTVMSFFIGYLRMRLFFYLFLRAQDHYRVQCQVRLKKEFVKKPRT